MEPINGLRHPQYGNMEGWNFWGGEEFSTDPDFFPVIHAFHMINRCLEAVPFLGLPPGYRFLLAGEYRDIWYDESLLVI